MMNDVLLIGLGNPGIKFAGTRHNVGIDAVRLWVDRQAEAGYEVADWRVDESYPAEVAQVRLGQERITVFFPLTFMNKSGQAVAAYLRQSALEAANMVVVHDELELELGAVKWKEGGSAAGHNGVRSLQEVLGTQDFTRLRLGIGRPVDDVPVDQYVLRRFEPEALPTVEEMKQAAVALLDDKFSKGRR